MQPFKFIKLSESLTQNMVDLSESPYVEDNDPSLDRRKVFSTAGGLATGAGIGLLLRKLFRRKSYVPTVAGALIGGWAGNKLYRKSIPLDRNDPDTQVRILQHKLDHMS